MNTCRVEKKREERARGIRANMDRINSRLNSVTAAPKHLMGKALRPSQDRNVDKCGEIRKENDKKTGKSMRGKARIKANQNIGIDSRVNALSRAANANPQR